MKKAVHLLSVIISSFLIVSSTEVLCASPASSVLTPSSASQITSVTISAVGDCTLGVDSRYNNKFNQYYAQNGAAYFLKMVKPVFEEDQITIANLEGTLTTSRQRARKTFTFKGPAKYTKILTEGSVEVVNLANNHTMDFGKKGFTDTQKALKQAGIPYCIDSTIAWQTVEDARVAVLGFHHKSASFVRKQIQAAEKAGADIIIVNFHWGIERDTTANAAEKKLGYAAIDAGADLVLGHHPHILQGIEKYRDRFICYSLGNFCFGGNSNPADKDTMIFQQTFYLKDGRLSDRLNARMIPCSLSGQTNRNDFQPRVLEGAAARRVIRKVQSRSKGMNIHIGSHTGKLK